MGSNFPTPWVPLVQRHAHWSLFSLCALSVPTLSEQLISCRKKQFCTGHDWGNKFYFELALVNYTFNLTCRLISTARVESYKVIRTEIQTDRQTDRDLDLDLMYFNDREA